MRTLLLAALISVAACSRTVKLETTPATAASVSLKVTNNATQAVTVYVMSGGTEYTLKSVAANSTEMIPVPGISAGTSVTLRAALADGSRSYTKQNVVLSSVYEWQVP